MRLLLVVPCYNEELRLSVQELEEFAKIHSELDFLFVNDGSTDGTLRVIEALAKKSHNLHSLSLAQNSGKAEAVRQGLLWGISKRQDAPAYTHLGYWDADLATPLHVLPELLMVFQNRSEVEVVLASRMKRLGAQIERKPERHYLGRVFATFASNVLQMPVYDTQCGSKIFCLTPEFASCLKEPFMSRWIFDVEILARFQRHFSPEELSKKCVEVPISAWRDVSGSKIKSRDFFFSAYDLFQVFLWLKEHRVQKPSLIASQEQRT